MLLITLEILTHIRFLRVFVYEYLMYCWLVWTKRATSCFIDIGCSLMLSRICLWSFPLAWAHWKITRCGFILFWSRMFVLPLFPLFSIILVSAFLPTRHMAINPSYRCDSKAWAYSYEFQQRNQTLQNSGIAITIWDLERIVQGACQLLMHSLNLFIVLQIWRFVWGLEMWLLGIRLFQGMYTEERVRSMGFVWGSAYEKEPGPTIEKIYKFYNGVIRKHVAITKQEGEIHGSDESQSSARFNDVLTQQHEGVASIYRLGSD